jgi:hypothetical protein
MDQATTAETERGCRSITTDVIARTDCMQEPLLWTDTAQLIRPTLSTAPNARPNSFTGCLRHSKRML